MKQIIALTIVLAITGTVNAKGGGGGGHGGGGHASSSGHSSSSGGHSTSSAKSTTSVAKPVAPEPVRPTGVVAGSRGGSSTNCDRNKDKNC